ncbi:MAG: hypothetical protein ACRBN8_29395 [Nannocystales bacterium]
MRLLRILTVTVGLGCFGLSAGGAGCNPVSDFQCSTSEDCIAEGAGGVCETNSFCTFPDAACPTGKRWHDRASSLAGMCFGDEGGATDTDDSAGSSGESGEDSTTDVEPGTSTSGEPTTAPSTDPTMDTTTDPTMDPTTGDPTTSGSSTGTGSMASCDEMYGAATDYMLCDEEVDSCRFGVTVTMTPCNSICEAFGGTCQGAQLNEKPVCTSTGDITCDDMTSNTVICICSR